MVVSCSGLTDNADGVASLDIRFPPNTYLEFGSALQLHAVARNAAGDSVDAALVWRTPDTTVVLDPATGLVTPVIDSGTARVQVGVFGTDTILSSLTALTLTLTRRADSLVLTSADSVTIPRDSLDSATLQVTLLGGSPAEGVRNRPVSFRVIDPAPSDSPSVVFNNGRAADSALTGGTGIATATIRGAKRRPIPDRAVVEIYAYRADGQPIPSSGRRVIVRFSHQ